MFKYINEEISWYVRMSPQDVYILQSILFSIKQYIGIVYIQMYEQNT